MTPPYLGMIPMPSMAPHPRFRCGRLPVTGPPERTWIQWSVPFTRSEVPSTCSTGMAGSFPMAAPSHASRGPFRHGSRSGGVVPESGRPAIAWIMAAVRTGGTIRAHRRWTAQATMPGPYCSGPGMVSGNAP